MAEPINLERATEFSNLYKKDTLYNTSDVDSSLLFAEGLNRKGILLVYNNPLSKTVGELEKEILNRMLGKLNSSFDDIALVNLAYSSGCSFNNLTKKITSNALVAFGVTPSVLKLNVDTQLYHTFKFGNCRLLFCDDLQTIDKNNDLKKRFWTQFSPLFS